MRKTKHGNIGLADLVWRRFRRGESGATAVEFAILGPIFFAIIGATMETAVVFFAGYALDSAVNDSARYIRTGQAQHFNAQDYRNQVCGRLYGMFDCDALRISVRPLASFDAFSTAGPVDESSGSWTLPQQFDTGGSSAIVMVEVYYKWPTILNIPGLMVGLTADGKRLLAATRLFRNEPFGA